MKDLNQVNSQNSDKRPTKIKQIRCSNLDLPMYTHVCKCKNDTCINCSRIKLGEGVCDCYV
jgi:hypothetical protein